MDGGHKLSGTEKLHYRTAVLDGFLAGQAQRDVYNPAFGWCRVTKFEDGYELECSFLFDRRTIPRFVDQYKQKDIRIWLDASGNFVPAESSILITSFRERCSSSDRSRRIGDYNVDNLINLLDTNFHQLGMVDVHELPELIVGRDNEGCLTLTVLTGARALAQIDDSPTIPEGDFGALLYGIREDETPN